jgi:hypothetical protein
MVARRTASATDQKRFEIRPLIIGQQSANQGCPPQRAALNQFSIPASIDLSTRPSEAGRQATRGPHTPTLAHRGKPPEKIIYPSNWPLRTDRPIFRDLSRTIDNF